MSLTQRRRTTLAIAYSYSGISYNPKKAREIFRVIGSVVVIKSGLGRQDGVAARIPLASRRSPDD